MSTMGTLGETNAETAQQKLTEMETTRSQIAELVDDLASVVVQFDQHTGQIMDWALAAELSAETVAAIEAALQGVIKVVSDISSAATGLEEVRILIGQAVEANKPAVEASDALRSSNAGHQATAPASD